VAPGLVSAPAIAATARSVDESMHYRLLTVLTWGTVACAVASAVALASVEPRARARLVGQAETDERCAALSRPGFDAAGAVAMGTRHGDGCLSATVAH